MNYLEVIALGIALSMDAATVSISNGISVKNLGVKHAFIIALSFGVFQGVMPLIGYFAGYTFSDLISKIDHWIALILLGFIGTKMILESFKAKDLEKNEKKNLRFDTIMVQSFATSIDALAVGITLSSVKVNPYTSSLTIGITTFIISFIAVFIGKKFGNILGKNAEICGGLILIIIAIKIFVQ